MQELSTRPPETLSVMASAAKPSPADPPLSDSEQPLTMSRTYTGIASAFGLAMTKKSPHEAGHKPLGCICSAKDYFLPLPLAGAAAGAAASGATSSATDTTLTNTGLFLP
jgi:hypothetical protein